MENDNYINDNKFVYNFIKQPNLKNIIRKNITPLKTKKDKIIGYYNSELIEQILTDK